MTRIDAVGVALVCGIAVMLAARPAVAGIQCGTVDEFNAAMVASGGQADDVTLTFDVVGVNPSDFFNSKGSLAQMRNTLCNGGEQDAAIKVYGTSEPLNTAHLPGTLKLEFGNLCCGGQCDEGWAEPNASEVIFVDGTEQCTVTMWVQPDTIGYSLACNVGTFDAVGDNTYANTVDHIAVLEYFLAGGGTTWELPNATASNDEVCWSAVEGGGGGMQTTTVSVVQDVTADPYAPDAVYPDASELVAEAGTQEVYLQFDVPPIDGKITRTTLFMHTRPDPSSDGDGGEVFVVPSNDWSEATLTWNTRPPRDVASLGRIGPAAADLVVSLDLGQSIGEPGLHSFAVASPPTDGNGTHFYSKEGSLTDAPHLQIEYSVVDADGDGTPEGPDCNDADPDVNPDATETCNGVDDDCDGQLDEGCPGVGDESGTATGGDGDGGTGGDAGIGGTFPLDPGRGSEGCACMMREGWERSDVLFLLLVLPLARRRSRP